MTLLLALVSTAAAWAQNSPTVHVESLGGKHGSIYVKGWCEDPDDLSTPLTVQVFVKDNNNQPVEGYNPFNLTANLKRFGEDNQWHYNGFDHYLPITTAGTYKVDLVIVDATSDGSPIYNYSGIQVTTPYTVTYDANGGSGAPAQQQKNEGVALTLSSTVPTRDGHNFQRWTTAQNGGGTAYSPGATYTANADATLYAQWVASDFPGSGTVTDPYVISTAGQWNLFASNVNNGNSYSGKYFVLGADINVSTMAGTHDTPFAGTFDGAGHTMNLAINATGTGGGHPNIAAAPFRYVNGATFKYINLTGTITRNDYPGDSNVSMGGLIGILWQYRSATITGCHSSVSISYSFSWDSDGTSGAAYFTTGHIGGFIGWSDGNATITDCLFDGNLAGRPLHEGGFVGYLGWGGVTFNNCLMSGTSSANSTYKGNFFGKDSNGGAGSLNNCYYTNSIGSQGTHTTATGETLRALLGNGWIVNGSGAVVPCPTLTLDAEVDNRATIAEAAGVGTTFNRVQIDGLILYRDGTWNTICLPFNLATLSGTPLEGATLKTLASSGYTTQNDGTLTLTFADATSIEAGKPYIIKWSSGSTIENPLFTNVTLSDATANVETTYATLNGSYKPFTNSPLVDAHNTSRRAMHAALSFTNPSKTGYTLSGWYTDAARQNAVTTIPFDADGTVTLYAKWTSGEQPTGIPYLKYNTGTGEFQTLYAASYTVVTSGTTTWSNSKWYVVNSNVTVSSRIEVSGTAHLILLDGATLTASAGIHVGSGKTLNIYAQSDGTGRLFADASTNQQAGIGGNGSESCGTITIHGGEITASCTENNGAGIGAGGNPTGNHNLFTNNGHVNIHGGTITATGYTGAGIGGGYFGTSGTITITGGTITANGGINSAGIGGGWDASANTITITGGTIYAKGNNGQAIGKGSGTSSTEGTLTLGDMKVYAGANDNTPVNASNRVSTCRSSYAKLLLCTEHTWNNGTCNYCGTSSRHVTYDSNNATLGTVPTDATDYGPNQVVTILGNTGNLERTGYTFTGWNTNADGSGVTYTKGATFIIKQNTTLYAEWTPIVELAANADNSSAISAAAADGKQHRVVLTDRTLYRDGTWNTLVLPFNLASLDGTPLEGFTVKTLETSDFSDQALTLGFSYSTSIKAGKPYIVKWTEDADLVIRTADDWNTFAANVSNGTDTYEGKLVKLAADISVSTMAGDDRNNWFYGTFDGCGHTLTINLTGGYAGTAPFRRIYNATIKNLNVAGTITTSYGMAGSIAFVSNGITHISNCLSTVTITGNNSGTDGGLVSCNNNELYFTNCAFKGKLLGTDEGSGGFVGWNNVRVVYNHCLFAPSQVTMSTNGSATFTRGASNSTSNYNNSCYYTQSFGIVQGSSVSGMSASDLATALGSGWQVSGNSVVPKMINSVNNIVNPVFEEVLISATTANVSTTYADFIGSYAPITDAGLLLDTHNPDGDAMHAALKAKRERYTFEGWYSDATLTTPVTTIPFDDNGNVTLYTEWTPKEYTITYNLNGGTNHASNPATYNIESATITLQEPTKTGYTFGGWFDNEDCTGVAVTTIATGSYSDITLYAKWLTEELELANNADNSDAISTAAADGMYYDVTLADRTIYKDGDWNTLCLPFDLTNFIDTPLQGATVKTLESTAFSNGTLTLNFSDNLTSIEAGKPYIVKWDADLFIRSAADWDSFATSVNNGTESYQGKVVKLANDISVSTMVGDESHPFKGTFDGCGHKLTVNLTNVGTYGAPFQYIDGATIRNLHTAGTISGTDIMEGGIAGRTYGTTRIENCRSSVSLTTTKGDNGAMGGIVGVAESGSLIVVNCLFDGSLLGSNNTNCAGIVNWRRNNASINISNCLFAPSEVTVSTTGAYTITRPVSVTNCYYTQSLGTVQGTNASGMSNETLVNNLGSGWEISDGNVVPKMTDNLVNPVFSNVLISDATANVSTTYADFIGSYEPITDDGLLLDTHNPNGDAFHAALRITLSEPTRDGYTFGGWYTDNGLTTPLSTTIPFATNGNVTLYAKWLVEELALANNGDNSDAISTAAASGLYHNVTLANRTIYKDGDWNTLCLPFSLASLTGTPLEGLTVKTLVSTSYSDGTLTMNFSDDLTSIEAGKPYIVKEDNADLVIRSEADWNTFVTNVNNGTTYQGKVVKLRADISVTTMVGTSDNPFKGTFDGCGHTLTVCYNVTAEYVAPFRHVNGATIKNLHVAGTIKTNQKFAGGLMAQPSGNCTISNCRSSVAITGSMSGDGTHGGIVGIQDNNVSLTITDCAFNGKLLTTNGTSHGGGIVGWRRNTNASLTIKNCLYAPAAATGSETWMSNTECATICRYDYTIQAPTIANCYYTQTFGRVQGTDASGMSNETLVSNLGSGWEIREEQVVPKVVTSVDNLVNPVFSNVLISDATADVSTTYADFIGSYEPITDDGLLLDAHNPDGDAFHAALSINEPTRDGYTFGGWYTDNGLTTPLSTTIPFTADGTVTLYSKWLAAELALANNGDNSDAISTAAASGLYHNVTLANRTIYKDGDWNTLCLPFSLASLTGTPLEGLTVKTLVSTSYSDGTLTMNFSGDLTSIEAGKPYIVKYDNADLVIRTAADWDSFATSVNNGTESYQGKVVKLANDISVTTMVGTSDNPFNGTFDGCGHTLTFNYTGSNTSAAPFSYVAGSYVIENLIVAGTINTTKNQAAGFLGNSYGNGTIRNCRSSVVINSNYKGDAGDGGFVAMLNNSASLTMEGCVFNGKILTVTVGTNATTNCAGLVGYKHNGATLTMTNCLYAPAALTGSETAVSSGCATFARNASSFTNCYYTQTFGTAQGTDASGMGNETLVSNLGSGWEIRDGQVVPKMTDNLVNPVFSNVLISNATADVSTDYVDFIGTYDYMDFTAEDKSILFLGAENTLHYPQSGASIGACRAYFQLKNGLTAGDPEAGVRAFNLNFGDEETGIRSLTPDPSPKGEGSSYWYSIDGRKLDGRPTKKGLYIHGGKTVVIRSTTK